MVKQQRLMFCSKFSFTIILLMFFLLFSEVFTNILNIYELPNTYHKIPKHSQILVNKNHLPCQFYVTTSSDF